MEKIKMTTPLVEMDGDEMTRILWKMIKDELILPFVDLKTEYYDLGLPNRDATADKVTMDAALANKKYGVSVKCATITPNKQRMEEYPQLTQMWKSPNGTIRSILDGTVFRAPILIDSIHPVVKNWKKPITIARHAYGDVYKSVDMYTTEPGECTMTFKGQSGEEKTLLVQKVDGPAVWQGAHNKEKSIRSFARACFQYAIDTKQDLWFSTKDTIAKVYDGEFKKVFEEEFESYKAKFDELGITYFYTLIDDAVARVIRSQGGFIWACKNYDGDVMSDMVSTAFGSLAMMTSVLVSPDGVTEYEAAHGTVTRHYYKYLKGEATSTNPMATIFAWSGALKKRGELDSLPAVKKTALAEEFSTVKEQTVENEDAFLRKLNAGEKVIAIELDSPRNADLTGYLEGAKKLQAAGADLLTIADCPIAQARMDSSLVACRVHRELGLCTLPHLTCRDRNLNATKALLLGLYAEGVREVLAITGDPIPTAERDEVKNVYQFNSRKLAQYIVSLAGEGREMPGPMTVFGALNLNARNFDVELRRAQEKLQNGMSGFLTQPVLSAQAVVNLKKTRETLGEKAKILAGIMPVVSQRNAIFMENEVNGIHVDAEIIERFAGLDRAQGEELGLEVSVKAAQAAAPYADGFYLMTPFNRIALMERLIARLKDEGIAD